MTYKILFNDAVAMTGGQGNDGGLTAYRIAHELVAMGVRTVAVVYDAKEDIFPRLFPSGVTTHPREDLQTVQERMARVPGVSAIIYVQTCAAEKRRRRKRGTFPTLTAGCSSIQMSAKAAAIAGCSRTASALCRWKPNWAASARSTNPLATRISAASTDSVRHS